MQNKHQQQFFKVLQSNAIKTQNKPSLENYHSILQTLKNRNYIYVDFNKKQQDSLILLQKTLSPIKNSLQENDDDDVNDNGLNDFQALGNQYILDMNNLSKHSYKMMRYISQGKRIKKKRKNIDEIQTSFIRQIEQNNGKQIKDKINFGPKYRKIQQKNKKLMFSNKISPQKLEEYLQDRNYRRIERRLEKSELQIGKYVTNTKQLRQRSMDLSRTLLSKGNSLQLTKGVSNKKELKLTQQIKDLNRTKSYSLSRSESQNLQRIHKQLQGRIKFPKIHKLSKVLAQSFTHRQ